MWGSTYLAIRIGVLALPAVLFGGVRFLAAGVVMFAWAWWRGGRLPASRRDVMNLAISALLMLVGANGGVTWSEQWIESNQAALIVATSALWLAWMGTWGGQGEGLHRVTLAGLLLGFGGVGVLVASGLSLHAAPAYAYLVLGTSPVLWAYGSVRSRRNPVACTPAMSAALQMLIAGVVMTAIGLALGEAQRWTWSRDAVIALVYLTLLGSCLAYGAYSWLVHEVPPALLGTYAYVNPAVAVLLGAWILHEHLNGTQRVGTAIILSSVILVTWTSRRPRAVPVRA